LRGRARGRAGGQRAAESYRHYSIQQTNKKTFETRAFIEEQLGRPWNASSRPSTSCRCSGTLRSDFPGRSDCQYLNKLNALEIEHERARAERSEIEGQLRAIDSLDKRQTDKLMGYLLSAATGSPFERLRNKLGELNLKRQTLLISLTEKHPQVEEVTNEIQAVFQEARKDLQSLLLAAVGRDNELARRVELLQRENMSLPEKGLKLVRLQREADLQQSLYSQLKAKYQEVLIQESGRWRRFRW